MKSIGRNSPCPCGSARKYKKCCLRIDSGREEYAQPGQFRFEPGSYGHPESCAPSIACLKRDRDSWDYHFVLVKPEEVFDDPERATSTATADLNDAFSNKDEAGSDEAVALFLSERGYLAVEDFEIVEEGSELATTWVEDDGLHLVAPGPSLSRKSLDKATKAYQKSIRNSPLWDQMVKEFGEEEAEKLLFECRVEERR